MLEIIPAIDLIGGRCVRLAQGNFAAKRVYNGEPVEVAKKFEDAGLHRLHIVDLDGAKTGKIANLSVLEKIAGLTNLQIDFGGGVRTREDVRAIFDAGAKIVGIGSIAVESPQVFADILDEFGEERILLSADVRGGKIAVNAWESETEIYLYDLLKEWVRRVNGGTRQILCTDINRDGMLRGAAIELYRQIQADFPEVRLFAAGGIRSLKEFDELERAGCAGAVVGKAFYESWITLSEIESYLKNAG